MIPKGFETNEQYSFPTIVNVCVYKGKCPANCVHCPVGRTDVLDRERTFGCGGMDLSLYKKIVDEVSEHPHSTLRLHSVGEPILWDEVLNAISYSRHKKVRSWLFTSAITKDDYLLKKLVEDCDIVEVSVNSINKNDYEQSKGVDAFSIVENNIRYMSSIIEGERLRTRLIVSRVESDKQNDDEEFVRYWTESGIVSDAFVRSYHSYNSLIEERKIKIESEPCHVHWNRFNIDTNGEVVVCFNELFKGDKMDRNLVLGNLNHETIESIWHGDKLNKIRRSQLEAKPEIVDFIDDMPCNHCTYCQPLFSDGVKSENQVMLFERS